MSRVRLSERAVGNVLTCSGGSWDNSPTAYAYQWKRGGSDIGGETSSTHTVDAADAGTTVTCAVTATNSAGSATATSQGTEVPAASATTPPSSDAPGSGETPGGGSSPRADIQPKDGETTQVIHADGRLSLRITSPVDCQAEVLTRIGYDHVQAAGLVRRPGCMGIIWIRPKTVSVKAGKERNVALRLSKRQMAKLARGIACTIESNKAVAAKKKRRPYLPAIIRARIKDADGHRVAAPSMRIKLKLGKDLRRELAKRGKPRGKPATAN